VCTHTLYHSWFYRIFSDRKESWIEICILCGYFRKNRTQNLFLASKVMTIQ
jgi:hypothetical protein